MKLKIETIEMDQEEEILIKCHDPGAKWVSQARGIWSGNHGLLGIRQDKMFRVQLGDVYYFEVVEGKSFFYTKDQVYESKLKLYEFEEESRGTLFFRASKSMVLNGDKIDCITPAFSGRFEVRLLNGETVIVSRQYVSVLKELINR